MRSWIASCPIGPLARRSFNETLNAAIKGGLNISV